MPAGPRFETEAGVASIARPGVATIARMKPARPLVFVADGPHRVAFFGLCDGPRVVAVPEPSRAHQVHGAAVIEVDQPGLAAAVADVVWTARAGIAVAVVTADCVPILLAGQRGVAAVHAGWRGLAAGAIEAGCRALGRVDRAWIGPAIGPCCYEVGPEVAECFAGQTPPALARGSGDRSYLDLLAVSLSRLPPTATVSSTGVCTRCDPRWSSYRRDRELAGRNVSLIWFEGPSVGPVAGPSGAAP